MTDGQQNEGTAFNPVSPYAASKAFSFWITANARAAYGLYAVNGTLFNHESPRRGMFRWRSSFIDLESFGDFDTSTD